MDALAALADDTRRQIVERLARADLSAGELGTGFDISQPAVSRHLKVLRDAGLVEVRRDAQRRLYRLHAEPLRELDEWLEPYRDLWAQRLDALDTEIARGRRAQRTGERA